jgi:hypothetical protein
MLASGALDVAAATGRLAAPLARFLLAPPMLPHAVAPIRAVERLAARGERVSQALGEEANAMSQRVVPALTDEVVQRMDLTEVVLRRVDLGRIVLAVLDRIDLTELVLQRVDLDRVIAAADLDAAAARLDVDAIAARLDLVGVAEYIIDAVDLPEIIRTSTGSVATEAVRGARMQGIDADEQLQRVVDRVLLRRRARRTDAPGDVGEDLRDEPPNDVPGSVGGEA